MFYLDSILIKEIGVYYLRFINIDDIMNGLNFNIFNLSFDERLILNIVD